MIVCIYKENRQIRIQFSKNFYQYILVCIQKYNILLGGFAGYPVKLFSNYKLRVKNAFFARLSQKICSCQQ